MLLTNTVAMPLAFIGLMSIFFHSKKALTSIVATAIIMSATIYLNTLYILSGKNIIKNYNPQSLYKWGGFTVVKK
jgi:hypothetical protein